VRNGKLSYNVLLNTGRCKYVQRTTEPLSECRPTSIVQHNSADQRKITLKPHMVPPGFNKCSIDDVLNSLVAIAPFTISRRTCAIVANPYPWGFKHAMVVSLGQKPQALVKGSIRDAIAVVDSLGEDYEGMFNGVVAAASVFHFHLQLHCGLTAIWDDLASGAVCPQRLSSSTGVSANDLAGWPIRV
jgi:hypothetical protein